MARQQPAGGQGIAMQSVTIYTTRICPYCINAKRLLDKKNAAYEEIRIDTSDAKYEEMLSRSNGLRTVPQIFIGNTHVGGCDDLYALDKQGKLDALLKPAN
jgi:glutaredoxin 3